MDFKRNALLKLGDKLLKAFEKAEQFDKQKTVNEHKQKLELLKNLLLELYKKFSNDNCSKLKLELLKRDIDTVRQINLKKFINESDQKRIDFLLKKYKN